LYCLLLYCLLEHRPSLLQILGVLAVLAGVAVASWPSGSSAAAAAVAAEIEPVYLLLCIVSFAFPALATIIKERIFKVSRETRKRAAADGSPYRVGCG
jgi:drug/metabolite transporter (DMT)-like permease